VVVLLQNKHWFSNTKPDVVEKWHATSEYLFPTLRDTNGAEHRLAHGQPRAGRAPSPRVHQAPRLMFIFAPIGGCLLGAMFQRSELWFDRQGV